MTDPSESGPPAPAAPGADVRPAAMRFILIAVLIDMLSIGLIVPVLPPLVGTFTDDASQRAFWYGAVTFAFSIASFFAAPVLGALSDRYGRRPVLLLGFCGLALSFFVTALADALWMLIVVRLFAGAVQANAAVANAYVADITAPEQRGKRFGQLGAMFGIGFMIGPVMGGLLGSIDLHLPFFVAGTLALLNLAYGVMVLPESLPRERRKPVRWASANPIAALAQLGQNRGIGPLVVVIALANLAQFTLYTTWVLYTTYRFDWGPRDNGFSLLAVGVASTLVQGVLLPRLLRRFGAERLAVMGLVSGSLAFLFWGLATQGWMMYAVIACNLLGFAVAASIQSIVSNAVDARSQGSTMGATASLASLMAVLAPVLGAPLMGAVSHLPPADWRVGAPMYFCAALQAAAFIVAAWHFGRLRRAAPHATG